MLLDLLNAPVTLHGWHLVALVASNVLLWLVVWYLWDRVSRLARVNWRIRG